MVTMWVPGSGRNLICVDSYEDNVLKGWLHTPGHESLSFSSFSDLLLKMEELLNEAQTPQSYTAPRRFAQVLEADRRTSGRSLSRKGKLATFELSVLFRQHSSWQGQVKWRERASEQSFRSVLELLLLMDSALRAPKQNFENHATFSKL